MTPEKAIEKLESQQLSDMLDEFSKMDREWHRAEWKRFIKLVRQQERDRVLNAIEASKVKQIKEERNIQNLKARRFRAGYNQALADLEEMLS